MKIIVSCFSKLYTFPCWVLLSQDLPFAWLLQTFSGHLVISQYVQGYTAMAELLFKLTCWQRRDLYRWRDQNKAHNSRDSQRAEGKDGEKKGRRSNKGEGTLWSVAWQHSIVHCRGVEGLKGNMDVKRNRLKWGLQQSTKMRKRL